MVIAVLPRRVCRAVGSHLAAWHTLGVVRPVSTRTRHAIHHALPDVLPARFPGLGEALCVRLR